MAQIKVKQGVKKGGWRHNGHNNIYSHVETSGARWGTYFGFSRPTVRQFSQIFSAIDFGAASGAFSKMAIFSNFKLPCPLYPPPLLCPVPHSRHARATPAPHPILTV